MSDLTKALKRAKAGRGAYKPKSEHKKPEYKTTSKQKKGVDNMLSGKFKTKKQALIDAGYTKQTANHPSTFLHQEGVQKYLKAFDKESKKILGITLDMAIVKTYIAGLKADKPFGRGGAVHPDYATRKKFVDTLAEFKGLKTKQLPLPGGYNQFNFFSVAKKDQDKFNDRLKRFLTKG